jgi:tryptophan halogenase
MKEIKNIVIVGGGTAGWSTAHQFLNKSFSKTKVIVISTKEIPIIGVGESTTGTFRNLINLSNNVTNTSEIEFLKETKSTFKIGIKHSNWHTIGDYFYSPLGDDYHNDVNFPIFNYDDYRVYHIANNLNYNNSFQSILMNKNKLPIINNKFVQNNSIAYHLDTYKVGQYLKRKAIKLTDRCSYVEGKVANTIFDKNGYLTDIITDNNQKISGDLFIDCSGFSKLLMNKFNNQWVSYKDNLLVNRAMPFYVENKKDEPIRNYTHAWAQKNGWLWEIPTQERLGCGYVYSDNHTTPEKAQEEIEKILGHKIEPLNDIKFEAGRFSKFWIKNVLSTGLSSAFVEPLEATSIHATTVQITHFIENYFKTKCHLF